MCVKWSKLPAPGWGWWPFVWDEQTYPWWSRWSRWWGTPPEIEALYRTAALRAATKRSETVNGPHVVYLEASCKHAAQNRMMLSCKEEASSPAGLSGLINKSLLEAFHHVCQWCDVKWCTGCSMPPCGRTRLLTLLNEHFRTVFSISIDIKLVIRLVSVS